MHLAAVICSCISVTNAVKHYGMMASVNVHNTNQEPAKKFSKNDMELVSVFTTDNHHSGSGFVSEIDIYDKTAADIFASSIYSPEETGIL